MSEQVPQKRPAFEPGAGLLDPAAAPPTMPRPVATVAGAGLVLLRAAAGVMWLVGAALLWLNGQPSDIVLDGLPPDADLRTIGITVLLAIVGAFSLVEVVLAFAVLRGRNAPRVALLVMSTLSVASTFVGWWEEGQQVTLQTTLLTLSLDILVLLALSSRAAAEWARRPRVRRRAIG